MKGIPSRLRRRAFDRSPVHSRATRALACAVVLAAAPSAALAQSGQGWQLGAVLDAAYGTRTTALGTRDKALNLGHGDVSASGPIGPWLRARLTGVLESDRDEIESALEEAWVETTALPAGVQLRAGRFASQIGYLNQQHPHADDFVQRPLLYRAFFGSHWVDDGLRLNWTAPTPFFLQFGSELFRGKRLVGEVANEPGRAGAIALTAKAGADIGREHSWQLGVSHVRNRREAAVEEDDHENEVAGEGEAAEAHEHDHHGAQFTGKRTWMLDATWKWAPDGNSRNQQVRVSFEAARVTGLNRFAGSGERHTAATLALVWRFDPAWEVGVRVDTLNARRPHDDHFDDARLRERALMVAWKPTHMQTLRLQLTNQRGALGIEGAASRALHLQYVLGFGAHGAHAF